MQQSGIMKIKAKFTAAHAKLHCRERQANQPMMRLVMSTVCRAVMVIKML